jgi:hypothetical protein
VVLASTVLVVLSAVLVEAGLRATGRQLVYPLDDTYIHMAVARSLSEHGVWGVTRHGFTSSTSSLLWPLLLALGHAVGLRTAWLPLALNLAAGVVAVAAASWVVQDGAPAKRAAVLLAVVVLTPLPVLVLSGMEHTLHAAATLLLAGLLVRALDGPRDRAGALALAAAAGTALRYESLFLVAVAGALLAAHGRRRAAIAAGLGALLPPMVYALVSISSGWYALPNSVLLKGARFDPRTLGGVVEALGGRSLRMLAHAPHVLVLVLACLALLVARRSRPAVRGLQALFVGTTLLHLQLADTGWLYRYEAYLVALGLATLGLSLADVHWREVRRAASGAGVAVLVLVTGYPLLERAARAFRETPRASRNIFGQQYQMGLFLRRFYPGAVVAANDIGAVSYLADVHLLDLYGLASMDVARARRAGGLTREDLAGLAAVHHPEVVVVYRSWFGQTLPPEWEEAGWWRVPDQVVVADRVVTFFAAGPGARERLVRSLRAFQPEMPPAVTVRLHDAPDAP